MLGEGDDRAFLLLYDLELPVTLLIAATFTVLPDLRVVAWSFEFGLGDFLSGCGGGLTACLLWKAF